MDLLEAKSRIAEALVESIFRRARYQVEAYPAGRTPLRFGREDFSPDFSATVPGQYGESSQEMLVEVKYRPSVEQFISVENQRGEKNCSTDGRYFTSTSISWLLSPYWPGTVAL